MQNNFIIACENVAACRLTCYKHSLTLVDQIADLHILITSYEKSYRSFETKNFFIDKRYKGMRKFKFKQSSFRVFNQIFHRSFRSRPPDRKKKNVSCVKKNADLRIIRIKKKMKRSCDIKTN